MAKTSFTTNNRRFGIVLSSELRTHCIPVSELMHACRFSHSTFYKIKKAKAVTI